MKVAKDLDILKFNWSSSVSGLPRDSVVKNLSPNAGDAGDVGLIPGLGRCFGGIKWHPTPVVLPGKIPQTEEPGGYSPRGS